MIDARYLPRVDEQQIIRPFVMDLTHRKIMLDVELANRCTLIDYLFTKAERAYLLLYGYDTKQMTNQTWIFW